MTFNLIRQSNLGWWHHMDSFMPQTFDVERVVPGDVH